MDQYTRDTTSAGVKVAFNANGKVPEGKAESVGFDKPPRAGVSLTVAPIRIGGELIEGFHIQTYSE